MCVCACIILKQCSLVNHNTIFPLTTSKTHATFHEVIYNYKAAGAHYCTCLHLVAMECCGHAEIVYAFQWIEKKVMKGSIKE